MLRWTGVLLLSVSAAAMAAPEIDRSVSTPVSSITREDLEKLPVGRRLEDLIKTCPAQTIPTVVRPIVNGISTGPSLNCVQPDDLRMIEIFKAHNDARFLYGSQPIVWDPELARGAADYARQLTVLDRVHAPREGRRDVRENLLQSLRGGRSPKEMVGVWVGERRYFKPGVFPDVSTTGDWARVGHYTQMIWPTTVRLGCAIHSDMKFDWTVCRYSPPGNKDGVAMGPRALFPNQKLVLCAGPGGAMMCPDPEPEGQGAGGGQKQEGGQAQGGAANGQPGQAGQAPAEGGTRERPRHLAPPNEGVSRRTGNCSASVIGKVKIIERKDPNDPNKKRRVKESHNLGHGFTEIVIPNGWDADVDWGPDPDPSKTFPAPGTMTANWSIVGQNARRNATVTGDYPQLQKGWDREWGLISIDPPQRPTVQQHRIEAVWDPVPPTVPDTCPTDRDFTVTFAAEIPPAPDLNTQEFVEGAGRAGFPGTRPRPPFRTQTRSFHQPRPAPFSRNNNVVVPIGIYWDLPPNCCDIKPADRRVIQFARAAIEGPNGRQAKDWGLDILQKEIDSTKLNDRDRQRGKIPGHDPTYTGHPNKHAEDGKKLGPGSAGGTRPGQGDPNDIEQWDAPGMPRDLFDRFHAAQGRTIYRQQFLSLLICKQPGGTSNVKTYLERGKVCQVAVTTVRWVFPGQAGVQPVAPRPGAPPVMNYNPPTISVSFDVRDGNCADLTAFLRANGLLDEFQYPSSEARALEILSEEAYAEINRSVSSGETNPFAPGGIQIPPAEAR
jgi:hypothetical protein